MLSGTGEVAFGALRYGVKRREWVKSRSQVPRRDGWLRMGTEDQEAPEGIDKGVRLKRVNRQQMIMRAVDVEKLIEPDHPAWAIWESVGPARPERVSGGDRGGGRRGGRRRRLCGAWPDAGR